jgi:hypothetical protein
MSRRVSPMISNPEVYLKDQIRIDPGKDIVCHNAQA